MSQKESKPVTINTSFNMDKLNARATETLITKGEKAFIEECFKDPKNPDRRLSYSEMRELYG